MGNQSPEGAGAHIEMNVNTTAWFYARLAEKDAEIDKLKKVISLDSVAIGDKNRIITELVEELGYHNSDRLQDDLIQRGQNTSR